MRVTIGERLRRTTQVKVSPPPRPIPDEAAPLWVEPEEAGPVMSFYSALSARDEPCQTPGEYCVGCACPYCKRRTRELDRYAEELGPPRKRGEMVWLHKTAPTLVIEGSSGMSPEEHEAGRRR